MRAFLLASLIALAAIAPADAARRARHFGQLPVLVQGPGWGAAETPQPPTQGLPGSFGYNDNAIAIWDSVSYALHNTPAPQCVIAHDVTDIVSTVISLDAGPWINAPYTTAGASPGVGEYCAMLIPSAMSDGQHEIRAIITPRTGIPRVLQSGATVAVTAGNPYIPHAAHGQGFQVSGNKAVVVSGGASLGFASNIAYYLAMGGLDAHGYMLSTASAPTTATFSGTTYGAAWSINQANGYGADTTYSGVGNGGGGQAIAIRFKGVSSGQVTSQINANPLFYVCTSGLTTSNYKVSDTQADALGACTHISGANPFQNLATMSGTLYAQQVVIPSGTGTMNVDWQNKGKLEQPVTPGESLFVNTNAQGNASYPVQYVDQTPGHGGTDPGTPSRTACTTSGAPCATIAGALANLRYGVGGYVTEASSTASTGCAVIHATAGYEVGRQLLLAPYTGTMVGPFTNLDPASLDIEHEVFFVLGNADYSPSTGAYAVSRQPGGTCIAWNSGDTLASTTQGAETGGSTIYLMNDTPSSGPVYYTLSNGGTNNATQTYINILPAPGLTANDVAINIVGTFNIDKLHVGVNLTAPTVSLPTRSVSTAAGTVFTFDAGALPAWVTTGTASTATMTSSDNGAGCASIGSAAGPTYVTAITRSPDTVTPSVNNFIDCPAGTVITFTGRVTLSATNNTVWVDSQTSTGPGETVVNQKIAGSQLGGIYYTNITASGWEHPFYLGTLNRNLTLAGGGHAFDAPLAVINTTTTNMGVNEFLLTPTCADGTVPSDPSTYCPAQVGTVSKLYFAGGSMPSNIQTGWVFGGGTAGTCYTASDSVTSFHFGTSGSTTDPAWVQLASPAPVTTPPCQPGTPNLYLGPGTHADFIYALTSSNNTVVVNTSCIPCSGEGYFQQQGSYFDLAIVNLTVQGRNSGDRTIYFESPLTNAYIYGGTFQALVLMDADFVGTDVVFSNNTCVGFSISGVDVIGGNC